MSPLQETAVIIAIAIALAAIVVVGVRLAVKAHDDADDSAYDYPPPADPAIPPGTWGAEP